MTLTKNSPLILGTEPIGKLLTQYAIPAIIAMTASSLYNMTDSIFIGHGVGALAIAGLALTFPLMNLAAAFGSLVGVGASTLVSVKLGQKDYQGANLMLGNVFMLNLIVGIAFSIVFLLFLDPVLYFFGASEQTIPYARDYMRVILYGNVITHMYLGLNSVMRSSGFPQMAMYMTLVSVFINCLLNPLFIFVFKWGIVGSAWATVVAQLISLTGQLIHFSRPTQLLHFQKGIYRLRKDLVSGIFSIGLSPFLMNVCSCMIVMLINLGLKEYGGDMAIYPAEDIVTIYAASRMLIDRQLAYCSYLKKWVNRETDKNVLAGIEYGDDLPEDLESEMNTVLDSSTAQLEKVVSAVNDGAFVDKIKSLENQMTDAQLALCDVYELVLPTE